MNKSWILAIVVGILLVSWISTKFTEQAETDGFRSQLNKNPSSWTQQEKTRYNDVMNYNPK